MAIACMSHLLCHSFWSHLYPFCSSNTTSSVLPWGFSPCHFLCLQCPKTWFITHLSGLNMEYLGLGWSAITKRPWSVQWLKHTRSVFLIYVMDVPEQYVALLHVVKQRSRLFHTGVLLSLAFSRGKGRKVWKITHFWKPRFRVAFIASAPIPLARAGHMATSGYREGWETLSLPGQPHVSSNHIPARGANIWWAVDYLGHSYLLREVLDPQPSHPKNVSSITVYPVPLIDFLHSTLYLSACLLSLLFSRR